MSEKGERCLTPVSGYADIAQATMRCRGKDHYFWPGFADEVVDAMIAANQSGEDEIVAVERLFDKAAEEKIALDREYGGKNRV